MQCFLVPYGEISLSLLKMFCLSTHSLSVCLAIDVISWFPGTVVSFALEREH